MMNSHETARAARAPVFRRELRAGRKSFLAWTIPSALLVFTVMSAFPGIASGQMDMNALTKSLPQGLKAAFNLDRLNLNEVMGYFAARSYAFIALLAGIYAMTLGANLIAKEERERTA